MALDLANTVIRRNDPARRIDRFEDRRNVETFVQAALKFRSDEVPEELDLEVSPEALIELRESIDRYTRLKARSALRRGEALANLFEAAAVASRSRVRHLRGQTFGSFVALSAMKLLDESVMRRCKACPDCGWLFLDKSKNQSRMWCDMAVCGNRAKAKAHYARASIRQRVKGSVSS
ncbi:MAG: CGNR zinc finger domain-containing protein [Rhizobiaceae bacterium]